MRARTETRRLKLVCLSVIVGAAAAVALGASVLMFSQRIHIPGSLWVQTWGGFAQAWARGVCTDEDGSAYVAGSFEGLVDLDPGWAVTGRMSAGGDDAYVAKFGPDGRLCWSTAWGTEGQQSPTSVVCGGSGSVYVVGSGIPLTGLSNAGKPVFTGPSDTEDYSAVTWSGGLLYIVGTRMGLKAINPVGNTTLEAPGATGADLGVASDGYLFVAGSNLTKLDPEGGMAWTTSFGARLFAVALDENTRTLYALGWQEAEARERATGGPNTGLIFSPGQAVLFVSDLDGNLKWVESWPRNVDPWTVRAGPDRLYVAGNFFGTADFDLGPGVHQRVSAAVKARRSPTMFVAEYDHEGDFIFVWTADRASCAARVAVARNGSVFVVGQTSGNAFIAKLR